MLDPTKNRYPTSKGKGKGPKKTVGGAKLHLESNPIPTGEAWRAQTKPCIHQDSGTPRDGTRAAFECLSVSCEGTSQQWTATRAGHLGAADLDMA